MSGTAYIVPTDLLATSPPGDEWHAAAVPADPTQSLVVVKWSNPNAEVDFESLDAVISLGNPWESLPDSAAPLLASFQDASQLTSAGGAIALPSSDVPVVPAAPDTVASALRRVQWPGARLVR